MKSSMAAPCFRNSGLLTTLNGCFVSAATVSRTRFAVPTGTVLLSTTTVYLFIARPISRGDSQDVLQVGRPVLTLGRSDGDEDEIRGAHRGVQVRGERQALFVVVAADDFLEPRLVDRHPAGLEHVDFRVILVDADDGVSVLREARAQDKPHVPGSDDGDFHFTIRY